MGSDVCSSGRWVYFRSNRFVLVDWFDRINWLLRWHIWGKGRGEGGGIQNLTEESEHRQAIVYRVYLWMRVLTSFLSVSLSTASLSTPECSLSHKHTRTRRYLLSRQWPTVDSANTSLLQTTWHTKSRTHAFDISRASGGINLKSSIYIYIYLAFLLVYLVEVLCLYFSPAISSLYIQ